MLPKRQPGQFFNLHKSQMNSGCRFDNFSFEPLVLECCVIPLLLGSKVPYYVCLQIKVTFKVKCEISVDDQ